MVGFESGQAPVRWARVSLVPENRPPLPDFTRWPSFPFEGELRVKNLAPPVDVEPPRGGEDAADCVACQTPDEAYIWVSERWRVRAMDRPTGLPVVLVLECRSHLDLGDLPNLLAAELGVMAVRLERAVRSLDGVARVHVNRWGDGAAHLHMWFLARPYGRLQLRGTFLTLWDDILPVIPESQWRENLGLVAAWLAEFGGKAIAEPPHIAWQSPGTIGEQRTEPVPGDAGTPVPRPSGQPVGAPDGQRVVEPAADPIAETDVEPATSTVVGAPAESAVHSPDGEPTADLTDSGATAVLVPGEPTGGPSAGTDVTNAVTTDLAASTRRLFRVEDDAGPTRDLSDAAGRLVPHAGSIGTPSEASAPHAAPASAWPESTVPAGHGSALGSEDDPTRDEPPAGGPAADTPPAGAPPADGPPADGPASDGSAKARPSTDASLAGPATTDL